MQNHFYPCAFLICFNANAEWNEKIYYKFVEERSLAVGRTARIDGTFKGPLKRCLGKESTHIIKGETIAPPFIYLKNRLVIPYVVCYAETREE